MLTLSTSVTPIKCSPFSSPVSSPSSSPTLKESKTPEAESSKMDLSPKKEEESPKKEEGSKKEEMVSCYEWEKNWTVDGYIKQHCDYIDREDLFMMLCFERFCRKHADHLSKGVLLELSGGPSVYNLITIAPHVQAIFFSDFLPQNLQNVKQFLDGKEEQFLTPYFQVASDLRAVSDHIIQQAIDSNLSLDEFKKLCATSSPDSSRKRKRETLTKHLTEVKSRESKEFTLLDYEAEEVRKKLTQGAFYSINLLKPQSLRKHSFSSSSPPLVTAPVSTSSTPVSPFSSLASSSTALPTMPSSLSNKFIEGRPISVLAMHFVAEAIVDSLAGFRFVLGNALEYCPVGAYIMFTMLENASVWEMDISGTLMECLPVNQKIVTEILQETGFVDIEFAHCGGIDQKFNSYDAIMFYSARRQTFRQITTPMKTASGSSGSPTVNPIDTHSSSV